MYYPVQVSFLGHYRLLTETLYNQSSAIYLGLGWYQVTPLNFTQLIMALIDGLKWEGSGVLVDNDSGKH